MHEKTEGGPPTLDKILEDSWASLVRGVQSAKHPFHTGAFGTGGADGPELRTVVLRAALPEDRELICHTDDRSAKRQQLVRDPRVGWLFYDPRRKVQLRLGGKATLHVTDELARRRWDASPPRARRCYGVEPGPGTAIERASSGLPSELVERSPALEETEAWAGRFAVIVTTIERLEWLRLGSRGHLRARFDWSEDKVTGSWLIP